MYMYTAVGRLNDHATLIMFCIDTLVRAFSVSDILSHTSIYMALQIRLKEVTSGDTSECTMMQVVTTGQIGPMVNFAT